MYCFFNIFIFTLLQSRNQIIREYILVNFVHYFCLFFYRYFGQLFILFEYFQKHNISLQEGHKIRNTEPLCD